MINPSEFLSTIIKSKGFARPNLFSVEIFPPSGLSISNLELEQISENCLTTELPGKALDSQQNVDGGYLPTTLPFNMTYQPINMTFRCSGDLREKKFFEEWHKLIYNETSGTLGWYDEYIGSVEISQLSRNKSTLAKFHLYEVWPGPIAGVLVGHDSLDSISEIQITLNYRKYSLVT